MLNQRELENYKIVYAAEPAGLKEAAEDLKHFLSEMYGVTLTAGQDSEVEESRYEILVGKTNRPESRTYYACHPVPLMSYRVVVGEERILFVCGGAFSAKALVQRLAAEWKEKPAFWLADGTYLETDLLENEIRDRALTEGSTVRVMTSNILAERWSNNQRPPVEQRAEIYAAMLSVYHPDLVGVQETDAPWQKVLPYYLTVLRENGGPEYEWILKTVDGVPNLTTILYRADRYRLLESSVRPYSYVKESVFRIRLLAWAVLEHTGDGTLYALVNTHWSVHAEDNSLEIPEEVGLVGEISSRYEGVHLFCTGDFNIHINHGFEAFKKASGFADSKEAAQKNGCLVNELPGIAEGIYIDHVFINSGATVASYETIDRKFVHALSDHLLQYGDYIISK